MAIEETLKRIEKKLKKIETELMEIKFHIASPDMAEYKSLFSLPDHLRKTALGLMTIEQGTASDVSKNTGRARAVESSYLNQLERQGYVTSFRKNKQKIFSIGDELKGKLKTHDA